MNKLTEAEVVAYEETYESIDPGCYAVALCREWREQRQEIERLKKELEDKTRHFEQCPFGARS